MIQWLRAKTNPVPSHYDCLLLLSDNSVILGRYQYGMTVVAWSVVNRPEWINERTGGRFQPGESHPKVTLSDADCDMMRELYESGGITYQQIADKFGCSKSTARDIIKCRTRYSDRLSADGSKK